MFKEIDTFSVVLICIGVFAISLWISYAIIKAATQSSRIVELLEEQNRLLETLVGTDTEANNSEDILPAEEITDSPEFDRATLKSTRKKD
jgi:hypothetical protein